MHFFFLIIFIFCSTKIFAQEGWIQILSPTNEQLYKVVFPDENNGYCFGYNSTFIRTKDGGQNWEALSTGITANFILRGCFPDNNHGYAVSELPTYFLKTSDAGENWSANSFFEGFYDIFFVDSLIGWICGSRSTFSGWENIIKKTIDGGNSWIYQDPGIIPTGLERIFFVNKDTGFIAGQYGVILKTTNGGGFWLEVHESNYNTHINSIYFADDNNGYSYGVTYDPLERVLFKTTNAGENWTRKDVTFNSYEIFFTNSQIGYSVGYQNIMKTTDGGDSWTIQFNDPILLWSICFINDSIGFAVGDNGTILRTTNGGVTFIDNEQKNELQPTNFNLNQNYPNPFNPSTKISWQSPIGSWQTLKVFDVLGNEVATLVNEYRSDGSYEIEFHPVSSIKNAASGIYFYQLKAGEFVETKKMLLIR